MLKGIGKRKEVAMIGVIERIKNSVLLKCGTLNDEVIAKTLSQLVDTSVYHFAEDMMGILSDINVNLKEEELRNEVSDIIKTPIVKKLKRKLFIDSLALQITNDTFIEKYVNKEIDMEKLQRGYVKELSKNKSSNQLNMVEDLRLDEIIGKLKGYVDKNIIPLISENLFLVNAVNSLVEKTKNELELRLEEMISKTDQRYLDILSNELKEEVKEEEKGEDDTMVNTNDYVMEKTEVTAQIPESGKFDKYDDMTLFNKMILSLNTKEEKLSRKESTLAKRKAEIDARLTKTNKNIEANIERENKLSQRKLELNSKEVEINSKLSEAEVIFLNMKPLIKGLNKIKVFDEQGGNDGE